MPKPQMHAFIATVADGTDVRAPRAHRIDAAYYQTGDTFTTFKDSDNQAVFTARNDYLISVARVAASGEATGTVELSRDFGDLGDLLRETDEKGHAHGRILNIETAPGGRVYEHGYDIHVSTIAGVDSAKGA